jgi:hypothetical protein
VDAVTQAKAHDVGRVARWMLLACTLFGLAVMHTLGHAGMQMGMHAAHDGGSASQGLAATGDTTMAFEAVAAVTVDGCASDGCAHAGPGHGHGGGMDGWSVCLAVLGGLAVVVLLSALLLGAATRRAVWSRLAARVVTPRGPPIRSAGLIIASVSLPPPRCCCPPAAEATIRRRAPAWITARP